MLSAPNRMRTAAEFSATIRTGQRSGNRMLVIHVVTDSHTKEADRKVGFVVAKSVGNSVVRHRVYRRLRHIVRDLLPDLSIQSMVVRAQPTAAHASSDQLRQALLRELKRMKVLDLNAPGDSGVGGEILETATERDGTGL